MLAHTRPELWTAIKAILGEELGDHSSRLRNIHQEPLAAASIAQIHRALHKSDGAEVVLKVQRPDIGKVITAELAVLRLLARLAERYLPGARLLNPVTMVEEFAASIARSWTSSWKPPTWSASRGCLPMTRRLRAQDLLGIEHRQGATAYRLMCPPACGAPASTWRGWRGAC